MGQTSKWHVMWFGTSKWEVDVSLAFTYHVCTYLNIQVSHLLSLSLSTSFSNWKANKQYVRLTRNVSTRKCVKISFATWHAHCKWNTWNVQSDKQLSHTFSVQMLKEKWLDLSKINAGIWSYSWTASKKSQAAVINKQQKIFFWLIQWATVSLELPQNCFVHCGISCCQETFDMIFHFVDNCWECCPSTLFQFISTLRLLYMFARRDSIFVTVGFSLGSCLLLRLWL